MSENKIDNVDEIEIIEVDAVAAMEGSKISDDDLDEIVGGGNNFGFKTDFYLTCYCPYHRQTHGDIIKVQGGFKSKSGGLFPTYYCRKAGRYYFEAQNGFYDPHGRLLVRK